MTTEDGGAPAPTGRAGARLREEEVVARLGMLATALDDEPSPDFRAATRARLVAMAAVRSPEPEPEARRGFRRLLGVRAPDDAPPRWRTRVTAGLAGAALAISALGTLVALSADAQPGDLLYDVKRGTEQTQLALAGDDRALTLLQFASTRLDELAGARDDPDLVVQTLATMDAQTTEGARLLVASALDSGQTGPVDRLAEWSGDQSAELAGLQPELPTATAGVAQASQDLLGAVQARAAAAQAALQCPTVPASEGSDDLGPVPGICSAAVPSPAGGAPAADPDAPSGDQDGPPAAPVPSAAPQPGGGSQPDPGPSGSGSGSGSGGGPGSVGGSGGAAPPTGAVPTVPSLPALPSLPLPGTGGSVPAPSVPGAGTTTPPPLIDNPLPLPLCVPPLIC